MKKVLCIDGGGIKGAFPASFLTTIEQAIGNSIGDCVDLIVGTSTGGILALGLGLGLSAQEILSFYDTYGHTVFAGGRLYSLLRQLVSAKYVKAPLKNALDQAFGEMRLGDAKTRLVIPSLNVETGEVYLFKTAHHERLRIDYKEKVVDVALATSAAPTFFPTHKLISGISLVDGGMWANNPSAVAAVEAITMLGWEKGSFKILSIGCTDAPLNTHPGPSGGWGGRYWLFRALDVMMKAQSSSSHGMALHLAGHENVIRVDPHVHRGKYALDLVSTLDSLKGLGASEARQWLPKLDGFFTLREEPFVPFHQL